MSNISLESREGKYLQFNLGQEKYALELSCVKEVISIPDTTPIPNAKPYYRGVMNLRGQIISIIDLRDKLHVKKGEDLKEQAVIIVELNELAIGVIVDSINKVIMAYDNEISDVPGLQSQVNSKFIEGVHKSDELTMLLNFYSILNVEEIRQYEQLQAS